MIQELKIPDLITLVCCRKNKCYFTLTTASFSLTLNKTQQKAFDRFLHQQVNKNFDILFEQVSKYKTTKLQDILMEAMLNPKLKRIDILEDMIQDKELAINFKDMVFTILEIEQTGQLLDKMIADEQAKNDQLRTQLDEYQSIISKNTAFSSGNSDVDKQMFMQIIKYDQLTKNQSLDQQKRALEQITQRNAEIKQSIMPIISSITNENEIQQ